MATWPPITRDDLRHEAGSAGFDTTFPLLIRRLIAETGDGVTDLDMPGGSGTAVGGFDGVVTATGQTAFVPAGTSVWELSVGGGQTKADNDYNKRTAGPDEMPAADVTYVQAILAPWMKARTWATERTREGRWKEVRAYNLDRIHAWLDSAPATTAWLAEQLGKAMPGVRPADRWWADTWLPSTTTPLNTDIVLAGRESAAASFLEQLTAGKSVIALGGHLRPEEARSFVAASLEQAAVPAADLLAARTLFVSDASSLAQLVKQPNSLVLFLADTALAAGLPIQHPHQFVLLAPPGASGDILVPPINGQVVESHLEAAGLVREQAAALGRLARRSLLALRRKLAVNPVMLTPSWAAAPDVIRRRLLLVGAWYGDSDEDRRVVEQCVGRPYEEVQEAALVLAAAPEIPFIAHVDEQWHLLSAEDAWTLLSAQLTRDDLEAFRAAVMETLVERDPVLDLDETDPVKVALTGARRRFSGTLRNALAQTLALLGNSDVTVRAPRSATGPEWARIVVRELFAQANADSTYGLWISLGDVLPLLAEAAPEEFLEAMSKGLSDEPPLHVNMFTDHNKDELGSSKPSPHTAFLWALEILAWSLDYFDEAVDVLGRLAALDPGGTRSNRPLKSLVEILSSWAPNTTADVNQRIRAIRRLHREQPGVARKLLHDLIPDGHGFQQVHGGPRFRDWKQERPTSRADMIAVVNAVVDMLLEDLGNEPDRYLALIDKLDDISDQHRAAFAQRLLSLGGSLTDDQQRARLSHAVRELIARHREYADTAWALPEDQLRGLESAAEAVQPRNPVHRNAWLFASDCITLGDLSRRDHFAAYEVAVKKRRAQAVEEVFIDGGLDAVATLAAGTEHPYLVGAALAQCSTDLTSDILAWLEEDQAPRRDVAFAYLSERLRDGGAPLRDELLAKTTDVLAQARILRATFDPPAAWEKLPELAPAVAERYWQEFTYTGLGASFGHALTAARSLTAAGRHAAALDLLVLYGKETDSPEGAQIAAEAFESLLAGGLEDPEMRRLSRYDFEQLFALLARHSEAVGQQRIVHIEWQLFPTLGFNADAPTLHAALAEEPAFFVELVGYAFRRDQDDEDPPDNEAERTRRQAIASRAYDVLHTWRRCPGVRADGTLDEQQLREWVTDARDRLLSDGRLRPGDTQIGEVLAFAPPDPDGLFPPKAVRELLEDLRSDRMESGLRIGIYNRRGVTSRGVLDGGDQEWDLAKTYRDRAEGAAPWPRTRKLLNALADSYEYDARRLDEEAEHRRRGLMSDRGRWHA
jgi:hypothetical protein